MNKPILELQGVKTIVNKGTSSETTILKAVSYTHLTLPTILLV